MDYKCEEDESDDDELDEDDDLRLLATFEWVFGDFDRDLLFMLLFILVFRGDRERFFFWLFIESFVRSTNSLLLENYNL